MKVETSSRLFKILTICIGIIVLLVLLINFVVNLVANRLVQSMLSKPTNSNATNLYFILDVRAFPYPKITVNDLNYKYQGKTALSVNKASLDFSLIDLFKKKLHIYSIHVDKIFLNLPNFPKADEKHQNENMTIPSQEKNPANQSPIKGTNLRVDVIDLKDLNIIYSSKAAPIHIGTIKIDQLSSDNRQFQIAVNSAYKDQLMQGSATLRFEKGLFDFAGKLTIANNQIVVNSQYKQQNLNGQIKGAFNNPKALESIVGISAQKLPAQFEAILQGNSQQLTIAPIQVQYTTGVVQADFNLNTGRPIQGNIIIPEQLLEQLAAGEPSKNCLLPFIATEIIKGINMNLQMIIVPANTNQSAKKSLIQINPAGINLENGVLPANLQQDFLSCFNYQLQEDITNYGTIGW